MSEAAITVTGLQEVQKALYSYSQQLGDRVIRGALRQGANYVLKGIRLEISASIKDKTGALRKRGFRVANSRIHNGKLSSSMIGIYISLRKKKGDPFYGRFQNDGWVPNGGKAAKGGTARRTRQREARLAAGGKRVPGKQFVQNSFASRREHARQLIIRSAQAGAEVVARKVGLK